MRTINLVAGLIVLSVGCLVMPSKAQAQGETNFVPIEPCRIFDTRPGDPIDADETRHFVMFDIPGGAVAGQGGKPGGCGIPTNATAVHINFTAVTPAGSGFLRAWSNCDAPPTATLLNFFGFNISNSTPVPICFGVQFDMSTKVFVSATDLVGDLVGYYVPVPLIVQELAEEERAFNELSRP